MGSESERREPLEVWISSLHMDERGTALTEFVATLPVFIIIFGGLMHLGALEREAFRVKARASDALWARSADIQAGEWGAHVSSAAAGLDAVDVASNYVSRVSLYDVRARSSSIRRGGFGEGRSAVAVLGPLGGEPPTRVIPREGALRSQHAMRLFEESRSRSLATSSRLNLYRISSSLSRLSYTNNQAHSAGFRYGLVEGVDTKSLTLGRQRYDLGQRYNVAVSPVAVTGDIGENVTIGFSRLGAERDRCFQRILGLNGRQNYLRHCTGFRHTPGSGSSTNSF